MFAIILSIVLLTWIFRPIMKKFFGGFYRIVDQVFSETFGFLIKGFWSLVNGILKLIGVILKSFINGIIQLISWPFRRRF